MITKVKGSVFRKKNVAVPPEVRAKMIAYVRDHHGGSRNKAFVALGISSTNLEHIMSPNGRTEGRVLAKVCALLGCTLSAAPIEK